MRSILYFSILPALLVLLSSCQECEDCLEYDNEPYVRIRFFQKSDLSSVNVGILEINQMSVSDVIWFQDTTHEFVLPLSMNHDESRFSMVFSYPADSTIHTDSISILYERKIERTVENYMQVNNYFTEISEYSFDSVSLVCKDTEICKSNEAIINIYF